jgi:hypothetical protein
MAVRREGGVDIGTALGNAAGGVITGAIVTVAVGKTTGSKKPDETADLAAGNLLRRPE